MKRVVFVILIALMLSGCMSPGYNCKGVPEGVSCMSAREVYNATEYADRLGGTNPAGSPVAKTTVNGASMPSGAATAVQGYTEDNPLPIRMPEKVMEIWIAPWEDNQGSLHMASTIYTEIEQRRWTVGESIVNHQAQITPLDVRTRSTGKTDSKKKPYEAPDLSTVQLNHPLEGETNGKSRTN